MIGDLQPVGEYPGLPPNFWRSHITPRIVDCAWSYSAASGTGGYASDRWKDWPGKNIHSYPWDRVYDVDYRNVLWDSDDDPGTAEQFVMASGHDWLPVVRDYAPGYQHRWSGRITVVEGTPKVEDAYDHLKYLMVDDSPWTMPAAPEPPEVFRRKSVSEVLADCGIEAPSITVRRYPEHPDMPS